MMDGGGELLLLGDEAILMGGVGESTEAIREEHQVGLFTLFLICYKRPSCDTLYLRRLCHLYPTNITSPAMYPSYRFRSQDRGFQWCAICD